MDQPESKKASLFDRFSHLLLENDENTDFSPKKSPQISPQFIGKRLFPFRHSDTVEEWRGEVEELSHWPEEEIGEPENEENEQVIEESQKELLDESADSEELQAMQGLFKRISDKSHEKENDEEKQSNNFLFEGLGLDKFVDRGSAQNKALTLADRFNPSERPKELFKNQDINKYAFSGALQPSKKIQTDMAGMEVNRKMVENFEYLHELYTTKKDVGRSLAYRRAVTFIKACSEPLNLSNYRQMLAPLFKSKNPSKSANSSKILMKVEEILKTGSLKKCQELKSSPFEQVLNELTNIWGVGHQSASVLINKHGIKGVGHLRERLKSEQSSLLTETQKIGLKYFEDFQVKIPRQEVKEILDKVQELAQERLARKDGSKEWDEYQMICCGSYRRGKETCGDIDILLCRKDTKSPEGFLHRLIGALQQSSPSLDPLLKETLSLSSSKQGSFTKQTYMGVCQLSSKHRARRIDIKVYNRDIFGFAILYFTGSAYFNRSLRLFARKMGYSLNDTGIFKVLRIPKQNEPYTETNFALNPGFPIKWNKIKSSDPQKGTFKAETEKEVFEILGIEFIKPEDRNI